jgi:plastocyanin
VSRLRGALAALAVAVLGLALLPAAASGATARVTMPGNSFSPQKLHVDPGATVEWENTSFTVHTVTSDTGLFDSRDMSPGRSFSHTFRKEGYFYYHCRYHGPRVASGCGASSSSATLRPRAEAGPADTTSATRSWWGGTRRPSGRP